MSDVQVSPGVLFRVSQEGTNKKNFNIDGIVFASLEMKAISDESDVTNFQINFAIENSYLSKTPFTLKDSEDKVKDLAHLPFVDGSNDGRLGIGRSLIRVSEEKEGGPATLSILITIAESKVGGAPTKIGGASTKIGGASLF